MVDDAWGAMSSDGSVIVTTRYIDATTENLIKYSESTGTIDWGNLGGDELYVRGISSDGSTIIGQNDSAEPSIARAFKYTESGGLVDLGDIDDSVPSHSAALAISADGNSIVGFSATDSTDVHRAFLYTTESGIMVNIGDLNGGSSTGSAASLISSDGKFVSGYSHNGSASHAFKYNVYSDSMVDMGDLNTTGDSTSRAYDISADGGVIVGYSENGTTDRAFKYTDVGGMVDLGSFTDTPAYNEYSYAEAVSADGSTIVGHIAINDNFDTFAFKHTEDGGMVDLGSLNYDENSYLDYAGFLADTIAHDVSADGSVIVGSSHVLTVDVSSGSAVFTDKTRAFMHTDEAGMVDLGDLGNGVTETNAAAYHVSDDGKVITGWSQTASADYHMFVAKTVLIDVQNTYTSLYSNGAQLNSIINLNNSSLEYALDQDSTVFGENDLSVTVGTRYTNVKGTTAQESTANLKVAYRFNDNFRTGIFLDQTVANAMPDDFDVRNPQPLVGIFAVYSQKTDGTGFQAKISGAYNSFTLTITRNDNLAHTEAGQGRTKLISLGLLAEVSYGVKISEKWNIQPFAGVRRTTVERTGYTESSGADFPITYDDLSKKAATAFAGVRFSGYLTRNLGARLSAGYEHDTVNSVDGYAGNIAHMGSFDLNAPSLRRDRVVASVGGFYTVKENQNVGFGARYAQQALNNGKGVTAYINYTIGF